MCCRLNAIETLKHCLWECQAAQQVWKRVARIMAFMFRDGTFSWGMAVWATVSQPLCQYEASSHELTIKIQGGKLVVEQGTRVEVPIMDKEMQGVWELLCTTTMWYIWTARCSKIFDNTETYPAESVKNVWIQLVHTLKGQ